MNKQTTPLLTPIGDKILVQECDDPGDIQPERIILPDMAKGPSRLFVVLRLGTERPLGEEQKQLPWPVTIGEQVLLPQYAGTDIKVDKKPCKIVRTDEILGVYR